MLRPLSPLVCELLSNLLSAETPKIPAPISPPKEQRCDEQAESRARNYQQSFGVERAFANRARAATAQDTENGVGDAAAKDANGRRGCNPRTCRRCHASA